MKMSVQEGQLEGGLLEVGLEQLVEDLRQALGVAHVVLVRL